VQNAREREKKKRFVLESVSSTSFFLGEEIRVLPKRKNIRLCLNLKVYMLRVRALLLCLPLLNSASGNSWPVARFKNGTVGVQNEGGKVMINSNELHVVGELVVKGGYVLPPKCMPPGGDKLIYNGTRWFCVCVESWAGETCEVALSPPPPSPPSPSPPPPSPPSSPAPSPPPSPPPLFLTSLVEDATQPKLYANDAAMYDSFGSSVSLYGDTALIGATSDDDNNLSNSGSVYVFTRSSADGTFTQQSKIHANDAASYDRFGSSVSLYGDTALIGAIYDDNNNLSYSGSVYVFTRSSADGTFTQQSKIHANDAATYDRFGSSVSLYGDTALIGAIYDDDNNLSNSGSVYVFKAPL